MREQEIILTPANFAMARRGRCRVAISGSRKEPRPEAVLIREQGKGRRWIVLPVAPRLGKQELHAEMSPILNGVDRPEGWQAYEYAVLTHPAIASHDPFREVAG